MAVQRQQNLNYEGLPSPLQFLSNKMAPRERDGDPKTADQLTIKQATKIAQDLYSTVLNPKDKRDQVIQDLKNAMMDTQDCISCNSQCNPDTHTFSPDQYLESSQNVPLDPTNFARNFQAFLTSQNISQDSFTGESSTPFTASESVNSSLTTLMQNAHQVLNAGATPAGTSGSNTANPAEESQTQQLNSGPTSGRRISPSKFMEIITKQQQDQSEILKLLTGVVLKGDIGNSSNLPESQEAKGKIVFSQKCNQEMIQFTGVTLPPLREVQGDLNNIDLSKMKSKLQSGEHSTGNNAVIKETHWPNIFVNRAIVKSIPKHSDLTPVQLANGFINKILNESPASFNESIESNKMRYLSKLFTFALYMPWSDVLDINCSFFRNLEQAQIDWSDWSKIADWLSATQESFKMRPAANQPPTKKFRPDNQQVLPGQQPPQNPQNPVRNGRKLIEGIDIIWMRENQLCIKYQSGVCPFPADHNTVNGNVTLLHNCAGCEVLKKPADKSHGARNCPHKSQFFGQ